MSVALSERNKFLSYFKYKNQCDYHWHGYYKRKGFPFCGQSRKRGYKLAIVSNKIDYAVKELRDEFFAGLVDVAIGESDDIQKKPAPDMVYKAIAELGADKESCVYIGDSDVDMMTA